MAVARSRLTATAVQVAPRLLGAVVRSRVGDAEVAVRITEVEAYEGLDDPASHAFRGPTPRAAIMFGPPGYLYCYFTYGMHWCANVVCGPDGTAAAVLLRAGAVIAGADVAAARRPTARRDRDLARGPARLAACLGLGAAHTGLDLCDGHSDVVLASTPAQPPAVICTGPRVGIRAATERQWRFWLPDELSVSAFRPGVARSRSPARQTDTRDRRADDA